MKVHLARLSAAAPCKCVRNATVGRKKKHITERRAQHKVSPPLPPPCACVCAGAFSQTPACGCDCRVLVTEWGRRACVCLCLFLLRDILHIWKSIKGEFFVQESTKKRTSSYRRKKSRRSTCEGLLHHGLLVGGRWWRWSTRRHFIRLYHWLASKNVHLIQFVLNQFNCTLFPPLIYHQVNTQCIAVSAWITGQYVAPYPYDVEVQTSKNRASAGRSSSSGVYGGVRSFLSRALKEVHFTATGKLSTK